MTVWNFPSQIVLKNSKTIHALETDSHCNKSFINLIQKWYTKMYPNVFAMEGCFWLVPFLYIFIITQNILMALSLVVCTMHQNHMHDGLKLKHTLACITCKSHSIHSCSTPHSSIPNKSFCIFSHRDQKMYQWRLNYCLLILKMIWSRHMFPAAVWYRNGTYKISDMVK